MIHFDRPSLFMRFLPVSLFFCLIISLKTQGQLFPSFRVLGLNNAIYQFGYMNTYPLRRFQTLAVDKYSNDPIELKAGGNFSIAIPDPNYITSVFEQTLYLYIAGSDKHGVEVRHIELLPLPERDRKPYTAPPVTPTENGSIPQLSAEYYNVPLILGLKTPNRPDQLFKQRFIIRQ
jgi:hypothetical protein